MSGVMDVLRDQPRVVPAGPRDQLVQHGHLSTGRAVNGAGNGADLVISAPKRRKAFGEVMGHCLLSLMGPVAGAPNTTDRRRSMQWNGQLILFDCGEGTEIGVRAWATASSVSTC